MAEINTNIVFLICAVEVPLQTSLSITAVLDSSLHLHYKSCLWMFSGCWIFMTSGCSLICWPALPWNRGYSHLDLLSSVSILVVHQCCDIIFLLVNQIWVWKERNSFCGYFESFRDIKVAESISFLTRSVLGYCKVVKEMLHVDIIILSDYFMRILQSSLEFRQI